MQYFFGSSLTARRVYYGFLTTGLACTLSLCAQSPGPLKGAAERIKVHGQSLEGNLSQDPATREVSIYLPPSYKSDTSRRYPVLYMLHGYTDSDEQWFGFTKHWINLSQILDKAMTGGGSREMIVVMPNAFTRFQGSFYSSSVTTGDWETYVAKELVEYVDRHYRTIANRDSRGLAGHSMGGYGTMRIGMKNPEVFSSIYLLSPCCMGPRTGGLDSQERMAKIEAIQTMEEFEKADFGARATFAGAAAWTPNPTNPPFYLDLPVKDGEPQPKVIARLTANAPLAMIDSYIANLKKLKAIAFDAGDEDRSIAASIRELDEILNTYGMEHFFEIYKGDHVNRIAERIDAKVLPFFSKNLAFE